MEGYSPGGRTPYTGAAPTGKGKRVRAEPTVHCFSRIEPFGVRLRFPLLERDDPLALIELYGAANVDWGQPSCALSGR